MAMRARLFFLTFLLLGPGIASGGTSFADEATFLAALSGGVSRIEFDGLTHLETVSAQFNGVDFASSGRAWAEQANPSGGAWKSPPNVLLNFGADPIIFSFDPAVDGVGFYNTSIADRQEVTLFDSGGQVLFVGELSQGSVNFLGFVSEIPIASGSVVGIEPTNGTIFIDDFIFGELVAVPLSNVFGLGILAALLVGASMRLRDRRPRHEF
jgi:hypothetical protein